MWAALPALPQACADKLAREIATYGNPPKFPTEEEIAAAAAAAEAEAPQVQTGAGRGEAAARCCPLLLAGVAPAQASLAHRDL